MAADTFGGGTTVVIDLGLDRGEPDTYASPSRSTVPIWFAPLIIGMLVLISSVGSTAPPPPALSPLLSLRVGPADTFSLTEDGDLLAQTVGMLSAYDLADGHLRWQTEQQRPTYRLRTAAGLVLLRPWTYGPGQPSTTALSLATGAQVWRHAGSVMTLPGSSTLLAVSAVRSGGTNRRVQGPVEALDPRTGKVRWRVQVPSTAVLLSVPGPNDEGTRMVLLHDDQTAAVHDLTTGELITSAELPPANYGPENPTVSGGLMLLRHISRAGVRVTAYHPGTLQPVWDRPAGMAYEVRPCGRLACLVSPHGVRGIDPADGTVRWSSPGWRSIEDRGGLMVAYGLTGAAQPIGIVDPATGAVLVRLGGWRLVGGSSGDHLLVTRAVEAGAATMVAVARPHATVPHPLAELPPGTGDCQAAPNRLVCRSTSGELTLWAYRSRD
ncbi:MAG TPA: PQQ-binding-like beta-propeller repeat protein [Actinoplanes sp.]|nr:PQQ-binding-like beta-propeller repeat protein [Actinoplanes sp.]